MILQSIAAIIIIIFFVLLLPKNSGLGSLTGSSDNQSQLPFSFSQKLYFCFGLLFLVISYFNVY